MLASSSSGNSTFIATETTRVLIDAGLSRRETFERLASIGERPEDLNAVLVTHEHCDHISGLLPLLRRLHIPAYLTHLTAAAIDWSDLTPKLETFSAGQRLYVGDLAVDSFTLPHDATDPVGFCVTAQGVKIGVVTDLGYMPESLRYHLRGTQMLVLESNHDVEMLKVGPYPWSVKQRVMGRNGHLSNDTVCKFILEGLDGGLHTLVLGHLSEHNNHPELVRISAWQAMQQRALPARLVVAEPRGRSEVFCF